MAKQGARIVRGGTANGPSTEVGEGEKVKTAD